MSRIGRIALLALLVAGVVVFAVIRESGRGGGGGTGEAPGTERRAEIPRLVDLGSTTCIPCKMMAPILEELKRDYEGKLGVEVIDIKENRQASEAYRIRVIPTQIFLDPAGRELFRHEGFYSKEDILAKWKELGFDLGAGRNAGEGS